MANSILTNLSALAAQTDLRDSSAKLSSTFERLSSGLRINKASDDPAGLALALKLDADSRVLTQAVRNVNDGISAVTIAESALNEMTSVLERIRELAGQAANGTLTYSQRKALDTEAQALRQEYFRLSRSATFNGKSLLDGSNQTLVIQAGEGTDGAIVGSTGGVMGTGTFGTSTTRSVSATPHDVELADLNGDGNLDIVSAGGYVMVTLGLGNGQFAASTSYNTVGVATEFTLGDVNNDGKMDLIVLDTGSTYHAEVMLGQGDGSFAAGVTYANTGFTAPGDITVADLNNDGFLDLASTGRSGVTGDGRVNIRFGNGDGTFGAQTSYGAQSTVTYAVSFADLNNDGLLDMVEGGQSGGTSNVGVRLGTGGGTFGARSSFTGPGTTLIGLELGDLNNDNKLDVVYSDAAGGGARLGNGDGTFGSSTGTIATGASNIRLGDFNGDGFADYAVGAPSYNISVGLGTGTGTFAAHTTVVMNGTSSWAISIGDINNDTVLDLVGSATSSVTYALGNSKSGAGPILPFSLLTRADALQAVAPLERKANALLAHKGALGALQSRYYSAATVVTSIAEQFRAAHGRIMDADVAKEVADMVRLQVLQQSGAAILAQANLQQSVVLGLLNND